jgi:hypothetical protein
MSSSKNESHPDTPPPVRCFPPAGRHAVSQDEFIYPLAALNAAQRRHLFFNGQSELFISRQEPSAPGTGLYAKKHAVRSKIARFLSVKALQSSPCRSRFVGLHDSSHPFGGVLDVYTCICNRISDLNDLANTLAQAKRARVNSEFRTSPPHAVLDLSRAFTYSPHAFFSYRNTQWPYPSMGRRIDVDGHP